MDTPVDEVRVRAEIADIDARLRARYHSPRHYNESDPVAELVFILISGRTPERKYLASYREVRTRYPSWDQLLSAPTAELATALRYSGLEHRKAHDLQHGLAVIRGRFGAVSLEGLRELDDHRAEEFLTSLPGVGLKSARCVLMYAFGRAVFPIDTHAWRVLKRVGLAQGGRVPTKRVMDQLQSLVPEALRYSLHVNLVAHGRELCRPRAPRCAECPIVDLCGYGRTLTREVRRAR